MDVAGLLLTGGASRRMGRCKATIPWAGTTLARHLGAALAAVVVGPALECGPGHSGLAAVADDHPGEGPLAALATGAAALEAQGWSGAALVVATDLPWCDQRLLGFLAAVPGDDSVVPIDIAGRRQVLCARYAPEALDRARTAAAAGRRAVRFALDGLPVVEVPPQRWVAVAGPAALLDVDEPADLAAATAEVAR
jgi:molybdopterin-guanine dinucleotide biosynthesis protein A